MWSCIRNMLLYSCLTHVNYDTKLRKFKGFGGLGNIKLHWMISNIARQFKEKKKCSHVRRVQPRKPLSRGYNNWWKAIDTHHTLQVCTGQVLAPIRPVDQRIRDDFSNGPGRQMRDDFSNGPGRHMWGDFSNGPGRADKKRNEFFNTRVWV